MEFLVIGLIVLAVLVIGGAALLIPRMRRSSLPRGDGSGSGTQVLERPPSAPPSAPADAAAGAPADAGIAEVEAPVSAAPSLDTAPEPDLLLPEAPIEPVLDVPEPTAGRLVRLRARLARSQGVLGRSLLAVLSRERLDDDDWDEIEESLIGADVGVSSTTEIVDALRAQTKVLGTRDPEQLRDLLGAELTKALRPELDRSLATAPHDGRPAVLLVVGVNGTGKTTTCGKLARVLVADGRSVLLGAADTFRAAAADQLQTWGERVGAHTVRGPEGGDPASVAFDAVKEGVDTGVDTVLIDTAGRLHTKVGLMDELGKVKRVIERHGPVDETLLVIDATTGQNGLIQARLFSEAVDVTGIVLTKLDGSAKGGIVIAVQRELGVPVKLVGLGEGPDDLAPFDVEQFVDAMLR